MSRLYIPAHIHMLEWQLQTAHEEGARQLAIDISQRLERYRALAANGQEWVELRKAI